MIFNSLDFLIFLPIVFCLYWFCFQKSLKLQNLLIVIASYIFYGWWDWKFLLLIAFTTTCSFIFGIITNEYLLSGKKNYAKTATTTNILINLLILGVYKYFNFFATSLQTAFASINIDLHPITLDLILPVGISFYTFQALSYTIDVYRGKLKATHDIISFFAFISFFPQLVAGPIERATNLLPQFQHTRTFKYENGVDGIKQILWGLFKKVVIADNCADIVDKVWGDYSSYSSITLVGAAVLFSFQIYGDFSGYSDIAIGTAKLFGIRLMRNFNLPYFSRSVAEFWKRWHISLNTWFVDYVYIPLGGSREGKWKAFRNTFIIFFLSGLWHGANWTYVTWGVYHALLFLPLLLFNKNKKYKDIVAVGKFVPSIKEFRQISITFFLACFGWIIFRAKSMTEFLDYICCIFYNVNIHRHVGFKKAIIFIAILLIIEWLNRAKEHAFAFHLSNRYFRWAIYLLFAYTCLTQSGKQVQFIYFQF